MVGFTFKQGVGSLEVVEEIWRKEEGGFYFRLPVLG